jgi:hypothetical protein
MYAPKTSLQWPKPRWNSVANATLLTTYILTYSFTHILPHLIPYTIDFLSCLFSLCISPRIVSNFL